jgi:hypothetical protein
LGYVHSGQTGAAAAAVTTSGALGQKLVLYKLQFVTLTYKFMNDLRHGFESIRVEFAIKSNRLEEIRANSTQKLKLEVRIGKLDWA